MKKSAAMRTLIIIIMIILTFQKAGASEITWTSWPATVYYFAHLSGPNAPYDKVTLHVTAADEYALYINGNRIDDERNDSNWQTVEEYTITVGVKDIVIAVEVTNHGTGNGNGLMIDIEAGTDRLGTTTLKRNAEEYDGSLNLFPVTWYYAGWDITGALEDIVNDDWYTLGYNSETGETILDDITISSLLYRVLPGRFNGEIDYNPPAGIEIVTGYPGDFFLVDNGGIEGGGISLRSIEGENIAFGKSAEVTELTDGDISESFYRYTEDPLGSTMWIDLENVYRFNKVVLYTGGNDPNDWKKLSVRSWAIDISFDKFRWEEVGFTQEVDVSNGGEGGHNYSSVTFPDELARYVQFRITDTRETLPAVGEIMVYGSGYAPEGVYESPWLDFGEPDTPKTFGTVSWDGDVPDGTEISIQTRSYGESWSAEHTERSFAFDSTLPVLKLQYRVRLSTQDTYLTPVLKSLSISYDSQVNVDKVVPEKAALLGTFPNPFNPETTISFRIGSNSSPLHVQLQVYSLNGQLIRTLKDAFLDSGIYRVVWNGRDDEGQIQAAGLYICRLIVDNAVFSNKMLLVK